ncbi:Serping1 [Columba guinea]|nr:Serping1 [Columba guinea]
MPSMTCWLPLVWLVATAMATVTMVPTPEDSSREAKLLSQHPTLPVPPHPTPEPTGDAGAPVPPVPTAPAQPEDLPASDAPLNTTDPPGPTAPEGAAEELGTRANRTTAASAPPTTQGPPGTSTPPCPEDEDPAEACGTPTGEQRAAVAEALGTFALRFYQHMAEAAQPDTNLLFSPINVAMGLSHLLLGARGETRERLAAVLAYPPGLSCVHGALRQLASAPGFFSAAQIFHHPELHLQPRFLNASWHLYGARPSALSGNESLDLLHVNEWVRGASRGLLPGLLPALPPQPQLLLLSAVHLQAAWRTPLEAKQTVLLPFLRPGRPPRLVPTMTSKKYPVGSFTDPRLQVQSLDPPTFLGLLRRAAQTPLQATALALPRLRLDLALDVVALVHDMAVVVDAARHRAVLALDEAGVEAAGAMATSVARTVLLLEALRPFLFVLWHDAGDIPLFMGRLSDPQP